MCFMVCLELRRASVAGFSFLEQGFEIHHNVRALGVEVPGLAGGGVEVVEGGEGP